MMKHTSKLTFVISALAVAALFAVPAVRADDAPVNAGAQTDAKAQKAAALQAEKDARALRKYDKNGNGVLDADELALKQANEDRMKGLREAKKKKAEERKASAAKAKTGEQA
jgi:hypothetical protein